MANKGLISVDNFVENLEDQGMNPAAAENSR
jgi:hypothetical protein